MPPISADNTWLREEVFRARLQAQGYSVVTLASAIGLSKSKLYNVLRGQGDLRLTQLARLARALGCHPWCLVRVPVEPQPGSWDSQEIIDEG